MKYYDGLQILSGDDVVNLNNEEELMKLIEARSLTFRGMSTIVKAPIMITFYNQLNAVDVNVAKASEEFSVAEYERFIKSLCQYMDSIELAMHR
ncbi:MAG: hypothetical protein WCX26_02790 [Saccharofermentanales bacterium]|jgi:hypothetical protein